MPRPTLKALLFDMDDTLIDWSQRLSNWVDYRQNHLEQVYTYVTQEIQPLDEPTAFYEAAAQLFEQAWIEGYKALNAPHLGTVLARALEVIGVPLERINRDSLMRAYNWQPVEGVVPFPDVLEVLPILKAAGVEMGIITNSPQPMWMRDIELQAYGLIDFFVDCRLSAADVGYLKPHPAIFETALANLAIGPAEAVFIGDNPEADIQGAQSVGMRAVLRNIPARQFIMNGSVVPDATIDTLHDLLPLLERWYPGWQGARPTIAAGP